jgi:hypothetical protein
MGQCQVDCLTGHVPGGFATTCLRTAVSMLCSDGVGEDSPCITACHLSSRAWLLAVTTYCWQQHAQPLPPLPAQGPPTTSLANSFQKSAGQGAHADGARTLSGGRRRTLPVPDRSSSSSNWWVGGLVGTNVALLLLRATGAGFHVCCCNLEQSHTQPACAWPPSTQQRGTFPDNQVTPAQHVQGLLWPSGCSQGHSNTQHCRPGSLGPFNSCC